MDFDLSEEHFLNVYVVTLLVMSIISILYAWYIQLRYNFPSFSLPLKVHIWIPFPFQIIGLPKKIKHTALVS